MINTKRSKNKSWGVGDIVNVGFVKNLCVLSIKQVKDGMPDIYKLKSINTHKEYEFIPHNGLFAL